MFALDLDDKPCNPAPQIDFVGTIVKFRLLYTKHIDQAIAQDITQGFKFMPYTVDVDIRDFKAVLLLIAFVK